jgi:ribonuclease Z
VERRSVVFELTFLGTAGAVPTSERSAPSLILRHGSSKFIVDCGDGSARQIVRGIASGQLSKPLTAPLAVLLTHEHADHILGVGGLAYLLDMTSNASVVEVYGSSKTLGHVRAMLEIAHPKSGIDFILNEVDEGEIFSRDGVVCKAFRTEHTQNSFGFVFEEVARRHFRQDAADRLRVPNDERRRRLMQGESIVLDDGSVVGSDEVLGPQVRGNRVAVTGDTAFGQSLLDACAGVTCIVAEATYLERDRGLAEKHRHLTASDAAALARESGAESLYLTHLSQRYSADEVVSEARRTFDHAVLAEDFARVKI